MRLAYHTQMDNWVLFEASARKLINDMTSTHDRTAQDNMLVLETRLRDLCIQ